MKRIIELDMDMETFCNEWKRQVGSATPEMHLIPLMTYEPLGRFDDWLEQHAIKYHGIPPVMANMIDHEKYWEYINHCYELMFINGIESIVRMYPYEDSIC